MKSKKDYKKAQEIANKTVEFNFNRAMDMLQLFKPYPAKQLNYCSAKTFETDEYIYLKSYNTIVAVIDKRTNYLYDALRMVYGYTSTSCQHIRKFANNFGAKAIIRYYPI